MKKQHTKAIPEEYLGLLEQGLLNMALKGDIRIIRDGHDITKSLIAQGGRINRDFEAALDSIRRGTARRVERAKAPIQRRPAKPAPPRDRGPAEAEDPETKHQRAERLDRQKTRRLELPHEAHQ